MDFQSFSCKEARQIDLVDYLASLGYKPAKISGQDYWYLSPLRDEKTPSFKVNRKLNLWFDHGIGKGGSIIDFGLLYHHCTIPHLLDRLHDSFSFHRQNIPGHLQKLNPEATTRQADEEKKIRVISEGLIVSPALTSYLNQRKIPAELAQQYCREVNYELYGKQYYAIGFRNDAGGYELRNPYFKGSSSPKGVTFIDNGQKQVAVFEGFFSFLSFLVHQQNQLLPPTNFLILNSLSFFEKSQDLMENHNTINLYLDRDAAGMKLTDQATKISQQYKDGSKLYEDSKDLNQWVIQKSMQQHQETEQLKQAREIEQKMNSNRERLSGRNDLSR